jgi:hypothetical protein
LQGAIASAISQGQTIGPLLMGFLFDHFATAAGAPFPGAPFGATGLLMIVAILIYFAAIRVLRRRPPHVDSTATEYSNETWNIIVAGLLASQPVGHGRVAGEMSFNRR